MGKKMYLRLEQARLVFLFLSGRYTSMENHRKASIPRALIAPARLAHPPPNAHDGGQTVQHRKHRRYIRVTRHPSPSGNQLPATLRNAPQRPETLRIAPKRYKMLRIAPNRFITLRNVPTRSATIQNAPNRSAILRNAG